MATIKKSTVFKYFSKSDATEDFVCQVEVNEGICNAKIGKKTFNLKRHLERNHPAVYKEVDDQDRENKCAGYANQTTKDSKTPRETIEKFFPNEKVTVSMTKDKFKQHIIDMVVENGIPLTFTKVRRKETKNDKETKRCDKYLVIFNGSVPLSEK